MLPALLYGTAAPALGLCGDLERVVQALRQKFPHVRIRLRADSGYSKPWVHELCERLDVEFSVGIGMNNVLKRESEELLQQAREQFERSGEPQRLFMGFDYRVSTLCACVPLRLVAVPRPRARRGPSSSG